MTANAGDWASHCMQPTFAIWGRHNSDAWSIMLFQHMLLLLLLLSLPADVIPSERSTLSTNCQYRSGASSACKQVGIQHQQCLSALLQGICLGHHHSTHTHAPRTLLLPADMVCLATLLAG